MKLWFSGVKSQRERAMLETAGVELVLADQFDYKNVADWPGKVAIDSGAYRFYKKGGTLDIPAYLTFLDELEREVEFAIAPDVFGDHDASDANWQEVKRLVGTCPPCKIIPVWHWKPGDPRLELLKAYLDESDIVAIGGLVPSMRAKDEDMLKALAALCVTYSDRFHLLGANWLRALELLSPYAASADTSKFMDGARYGHLIFQHSGNHRLTQCPAKALNSTLDRVGRCVLSARNMNKFFNLGETAYDLTLDNAA